MVKVWTIFTFKPTSKNRGKYVLVKDPYIYQGVMYMQEKYGDEIENSYPATKRDFNLMSKWKDCMYAECKGRITEGWDIVRKRKLKLLEVKTF